jgi:hypothetical protein
VKRATRIKYYDDLLEENTERAMRGLSPTEEYKRLDDIVPPHFVSAHGCDIKTLSLLLD